MKARKLAPGCYEYRGWIIEKIEDHWNMRPKTSEFWTDAASTLTEAKRMIDNWSNE